MKNRFWIMGPKTELGKWSLGLIIVMFLLLSVGLSYTLSLYEGIAPGDTIMADLPIRPALWLTTVTGFLAGIMALTTGLLAIFWQKERAVLVYLSTFFGAGLAFLLIAEVLFPH